MAVVHGCSSLHHRPHVVCRVQLQDLLGDDLMTACSHTRNYVSYGRPTSPLQTRCLTSRPTFTPSLFAPGVRLTQKPFNNISSLSATDQLLCSIHRGTACHAPLQCWRRWCGATAGTWAGWVQASRRLCLGRRSPLSSDSGVTDPDPLHHTLYHLRNTHTQGQSRIKDGSCLY